jgi:hypothetical protein
LAFPAGDGSAEAGDGLDAGDGAVGGEDAATLGSRVVTDDGADPTVTEQAVSVARQATPARPHARPTRRRVVMRD